MLNDWFYGKGGKSHGIRRSGIVARRKITILYLNSSHPEIRISGWKEK
jgi:hypothetical protein